jgi:6-phosphogluconolactonase (cycloisomerase 2 family)
LGGYTPDAGGRGEGIHLLSASLGAQLHDLGLATRVDSPSFLALHPERPVLYAVSEVRGTVAAYTILEWGGLAPLGEPWDAGAGACHVAVDPAGRFVMVSCWGSGDVVLYALDVDGRLGGRHVSERADDPHGEGSSSPGADPDPYTGEGRRSRAHATLVLGDGRVVSTDLGFDLLRFWTYASGDGLRADHEVVLPADTGPRHLVEHPDGRLLVVTEYSCEVVALVPSDGGPGAPYEVSDVVQAVEVAPGDKASELTLSPDARHLYVSVRGSDRLATIVVDEGRLEVVAVTPSGGRCPRQQVVDGPLLRVAHEGSDEVVTAARDLTTGVPGEVLHRLPVGSPTALLPAGRHVTGRG